jgi:predicted ATP-dependent endonuclease of OLD family
MKISKIIIPNFQQFRNFQLDLTYPENHEKAGQPLDKVCFIGKNATGKTTLLEILNELFNEGVIVPPTPDNHWFLAKFIHNNDQYYKIYGHTSTKFIISNIESDKVIRNLSYDDFNYNKNIQNLNKFVLIDPPKIQKSISLFHPRNSSNLFIFCPSESETNELLKMEGVPETDLNNALKEYERSYNSKEISNNTIKDFWEQLIYLEKKRENDFKEYLQKNKDRVYGEVEKEFDKNYPTILREIAALWDKILGKAGLYFDYENAKNPIQLTDNLLAYIKLKSTKETIPYNKLSAGIRNFIFRLGHIYSLYFNRGIENGFLLIDEPENSLYPDFLYDLIEIYQSIIKNTQFFVATHNPIIAAQFDPAERIHLDFDDQGYVTARTGTSPEGDDPNDILEKDFLIRSLLGKPAIEKWERFLELKSLIKETKDKEEKMRYTTEYLQIGNSYNFPLQ